MVNVNEEVDQESPLIKKKRVEYDDLYRRSTQFSVWSFTKDELQKQREQVNERGKVMSLERSQLVVNPVTGDTEKVDIVPLTVEEELKIIAYYARKLNGLANLFKMPSQVKGTAISYLKKFYLNHSVMEFHPKHIMLTCLFLAAKSENYFIGIKTFAAKINNTPPENILKYEYTIIQSLKFTLMVHHPFRSLYGFYLDIQNVLPKVDKGRIGKSFDRTRELINESLISDAGFLFTPPQIALASWRKIDRELVEKYLRRKYPVKTITTIKEEPETEISSTTTPETDTSATPDVQEQQTINKLIVVLDECEKLLNTGYDPTLEESKIIDKKVHYCITPSKMLKRKRDKDSTPLEPSEVKRQKVET